MTTGRIVTQREIEDLRTEIVLAALHFVEADRALPPGEGYSPLQVQRDMTLSSLRRAVDDYAEARDARVARMQSGRRS